LDDAAAARLDFWQFVHAGAQRPHHAERFAQWTADKRRHDPRAIQAQRAQQLGDLGIEVHFGSAVFTGANTIAVHGRELTFERAIIAPVQTSLPAEALDRDAGTSDAIQPLTAETWPQLATLPRRLAIVGAGSAAVELADLFAQLGTEVHLVTPKNELLPGEDTAAANLVARGLEHAGVRIHRGWSLRETEQLASARLVTIQRVDELRKLLADELLVLAAEPRWQAPGGLAAARLKLRDTGLVVDERLRTSNSRIYAAGICCAAATPLPDAEGYGRLAVRNALLSGGEHYAAVVVPRVVRSRPQLVQIGCTTHEAPSLGFELDTYRCTLGTHADHFALIHTKRGTGRLVGATLVAHDAAALAPLLALMVKEQLSLEVLAELTAGHVAGFEALRAIAQQYARGGATTASNFRPASEAVAQV
jgi:pyruvate/2-oxoglutarate dehydrogenase complex dihydrolipoamide dehydrogenase (E3) component